MNHSARFAPMLWVVFFVLHGCTPPAEVADPNGAFVDSLLTATFPPDGPGGAVLVAQAGKILHEKGYGLANMEANAPVTPASAFYLASVSKQFTTMSAMLLAEDGALAYDDLLTKYFPDFPAYGAAITVRHLMTHTSGLPDYYDLVADYTGMTNRRVYDLLLTQDTLNFPTGSQYQYSNSAYVLLSMVIEKAAGMSFHDFVHQRIFEPVGMANSVVFDPTAPEVPNRLRGYEPAEEGGFQLRDYNAFTTGGGGLFSTVRDLYQWDQALYTEQLIPQARLAEAYTPTPLNDGTTSNYGFGWFLGEYAGMQMVWHSGSLDGFRNYLVRIPEAQFTVILLCNRADANPSELVRQIVEKYLGPQA